MPKSDKDSVDLVNNLFSFAKEGILPQRRKWLQRYKYWRAQETIKRPQYKDNVRIPLIFMISDGIQAVLTDNRPKITFLPQEENDIETADALNQIIGDYYWDQQKLFRVSEEVIWWGLNISGSGLAKFGVDPLTEKFYTTVCNSFACYPDPSGLSLDKLDYFIYATPTPLSELKRIYGDRAKQVKEQSELSALSWDDEEILSPWARSSWKSENLIGLTQDKVFKKQYGRALVLECWVKDDQTVKIPVQENEIENEHELFRNNQTPEVKAEQNHVEHSEAHNLFVANAIDNPDVPTDIIDAVINHITEHQEYPQETRQLKYPQGKIITAANNVLLSEQAAPFGLNYLKFDCILNPVEFWATTIQEYLQSLQDSRQRRKRQLSDNADLMANQREFYNIFSVGTEYENKVKNEPGEQIPTQGDPRAAVYIPAVPPLAQQVMEDALDSERLIEKVSGYPEALQGKYPPGASGIALAELIESMAPRLRKIARHYEWFLECWARNMIVMLPYEEPHKIFAILGQKKPQYLRLDELNITGEFNIRLAAGSTLPTSRMAKEERALKMFQGGIFDLEAVLEYLDDPQREKILERRSIVQEQGRLIQALMEQVQVLQGGEGQSPIGPEHEAVSPQGEAIVGE